MLIVIIAFIVYIMTVIGICIIAYYEYNERNPIILIASHTLCYWGAVYMGVKSVTITKTKK